MNRIGSRQKVESNSPLIGRSSAQTFISNRSSRSVYRGELLNINACERNSGKRARTDIDMDIIVGERIEIDGALRFAVLAATSILETFFPLFLSFFSLPFLSRSQSRDTLPAITSRRIGLTRFDLTR